MSEHKLEKAIREAPIHLLTRADKLVRLEAQKQMRELRSRCSGSKRLEGYGFKAYSQHDEDGIIQEIFRRIGTTTQRFVEFGAGIGLESNCAFLLLQGWSGAWAEGNSIYTAEIHKTFEREIQSGQLLVSTQMITKDNVNSLVESRGDLGLLSIDVDGNDYTLWEAVKSKPRVVAIEYNAAFPPPAKVVQAYQPELNWNGTTYYGASLMALEELATVKGYTLVGTNITGVNAFFVRNELVGDRFVHESLTELYNPARYALGEFGFDGHPAGWGKWR